MPHYLCAICAHEFDSTKRFGVRCDWCNSTEIIKLEDKTPLEKMCENIPELLDKLKALKEKWEKNHA